MEASLAFKVCEKLKGTRHQLGMWKTTTKPNSKRRIEELREDIRKGMVDGRVQQDYIRGKEKELVVALKEEELYSKMKSRNTWLREGDKNMKFFHAQTIQWWRSNQL